MYKPIVSVVIPTKNSGKTIETCLKSIKLQTFPNFEVIVVDNYSTDKTGEIARELGVKMLLIGPERSAQRNYGAKHSSGEFLFFVDSDMELTPKVLEKCVEKAGLTEAAAVIVPEISVGEGFWAKCKALEKLCYIGDETIEAARFFRTDVFWEMGGYDEEIAGGGEDWDLPLRIRKAGHKIERETALILHHVGKLDLLELLKKKYYYSKTIDKYIKRHPDMARRQLVPLRRSFLRSRSFRKDPMYATGLLIMKMCEFAAGGLGFIYSRLRR
jgi:glycosyltransferase involved in cell wall biosynthesis